MDRDMVSRSYDRLPENTMEISVENMLAIIGTKL